MSENNDVLVDISLDGVATLTLNRPQTHHAFDDSMLKALLAALKEIEQTPATKLLILKSVGKHFCAGADLGWMKKIAQFSAQENLQDARLLAQFLHRLYQFKKPTLAIVQGMALGGGVGLVAACHMVICSTNASFCFSETKLGLIPAIISPYIINAIGHRLTRAYFLSAMPFDAMTALQMGLCQEVVTEEKLPARSQEWVNTILQNGPKALFEVNQLLTKFQAVHITPDLIELTAEKIAALRISKEGQEGIAAFLEKRKPQWPK